MVECIPKVWKVRLAFSSYGGFFFLFTGNINFSERIQIFYFYRALLRHPRAGGGNGILRLKCNSFQVSKRRI